MSATQRYQATCPLLRGCVHCYWEHILIWMASLMAAVFFLHVDRKPCKYQSLNGKKITRRQWIQTFSFTFWIYIYIYGRVTVGLNTVFKPKFLYCILSSKGMPQRLLQLSVRVQCDSLLVLNVLLHIEKSFSTVIASSQFLHEAQHLPDVVTKIQFFTIPHPSIRAL